MQRRIVFLLSIFLAIFALVFTASATDIYVSDVGDDTAAGTVDAPVATLEQAYTLLGANGGRVLLMDTVTVSTTNNDCFIEPTHSGKITMTSAIGTNGALDLTDLKHFHFSGETEWNNLEIVAGDIVLSADNHCLTMGEGLTVSTANTSSVEYRGGHRFCGAKLHLTAYCPCETADTTITAAGGRLNVYSGEYQSISAWYGGEVELSGGETVIVLDARNPADSIWTRYLCPGLFGNLPREALTGQNFPTVTLVIGKHLNAVETYRTTQNVLKGRLKVNWVLKGSVQGDATAITAWDCTFGSGASCNVKVYADQDNIPAYASAGLLLRSTPSTGSYMLHALTEYSHDHEIYTAVDGRLLCCFCEYEQCRHLTTEDVVTTPPSCRAYGVLTTFCTDICKEVLSEQEIPEYNQNEHYGNEIYYRYSTTYDFMAYRCRGCDARLGIIRRADIGNHIIIGEGGTDYSGAALPPTDGSPFHFATYSAAMQYLNVAYHLLDDLTIEFRGDVVIPYAIDLPILSGDVHLTGSQNARLIFNCHTKRIRANNDMIIDNIKFAECANDANGIVVCAQNHKLIMGEGITTQVYIETVNVNNYAYALADTNLYVIGGFPGSNAHGQTIDADITVRSGTYRFVGGWNFNASTNDGQAKMTIGKTNPLDTLSIEYLCPFSRGDGYITEQAETTIIIDGDVAVDRFYVTTLNKATESIPYVTNIVLKGDIRGSFDIRGTADNVFYPNTIVKVYVDGRIANAVTDAAYFCGPYPDQTLNTIGATVYSYTYRDYCSNFLDGHIDNDSDECCDECGFDMSAVE